MVYLDVVVVVVVVVVDDMMMMMMTIIIINNNDQSFQAVDISYMSCTVWKAEYKHKKKRIRDLQANDTKRFINAESNTVQKMA